MFVVVAGTVSRSQGGFYFLVREFRGATCVATYACNVWETILGEMEAILGQDSEFIQDDLDDAVARVCYPYCIGSERDKWPGIYGSDEGAHEVFRFAFKAREVNGPDTIDTVNWNNHYQVSATFNTVTRRFGVQRKFIDDGKDAYGDARDEWLPRAYMVRNQQMLRVYYDSYQDLDSRPIITTRDVAGGEKTRRVLGKHSDQYPLKDENKQWSTRQDPTIYLRLFHDEDFAVMRGWIGDCVVFDFREPKNKGRSGEENELV